MMSQSEKDTENNDEESQDRQEVERKERTTPRQLWESRRQENQNEEAARRLNVQPIEEREQDDPPADSISAGDETRASSEQVDYEPDAELPETDDDALPVSELDGDEIEESEEPNMAEQEGPEADDLQENESVESPSETELPEPEEVPAAEDEPTEAEGADQPEARMVEDAQQPGMMRYQYATHGPPPEEEDGSLREKMVPSSFVLGVLIIVGALLIGLALVAQHSRIVDLEDRVKALESAISQEHGITDMNEED